MRDSIIPGVRAAALTTCLFALGACAPAVDHDAAETIVLETNDQALRGDRDITELPGGFVLAPGTAPDLGPAHGAGSFEHDLMLAEEERDCTFQERANIKCPNGKLLGACIVRFEEWADGSIHTLGTTAYCSIDTTPSS